MKVYVLSYGAGVIGVYKTRLEARAAWYDYKYADYKNLRIDEFILK
jgi:hypothetical protein